MTQDLREALEDAFAEIEYCINSVQGALRHRQQAQDYHFHTALKACRDGRAALIPLPAPDAGWRTIDSAPKDGTHVLVGNVDAQWLCAGYYEPERDTWYEVGSHWTDASDGSLRGVSHWLPLPAPPVGGSAPAKGARPV